MTDKVNVEDIIGLVKTDEVTNSVDEVRKLRGRSERMSEIVKAFRFNNEKGHWEMLVEYTGKDDEIVSEWCGCSIVNVDAVDLLLQWESLVEELSNKEVSLYNLKEAYLIAEADIVNNTDFKALYGANNQKVRDNHVKSELSDMVSDMKALEFGINWIRSYIPLLKEVIRVKQ